MSFELVEIESSERSHLESYSECLWQYAYPPSLLDESVSKRLWIRSYSLAALTESAEKGERFYWIHQDRARAGFLSFRFDHESRVLYLSKLYLHPDYWGKGLGHDVLLSVSEIAQDQGADRIQLFVFRKNTRAVRAYLRAGFRVQRAEITEVEKGLVYDDYVMVLDLVAPLAH